MLTAERSGGTWSSARLSWSRVRKLGRRSSRLGTFELAEDFLLARSGRRRRRSALLSLLSDGDRCAGLADDFRTQGVLCRHHDITSHSSTDRSKAQNRVFITSYERERGLRGKCCASHCRLCMVWMLNRNKDQIKSKRAGKEGHCNSKCRSLLTPIKA